jgi:cell division septation protein DedD
METRTKERLTGAIILVAIVVLLVPEIFSGRRQPQSQTDAPLAEPAAAGTPVRRYTAPLGTDGDATMAAAPVMDDLPAAADALPAPADSLPAPEVQAEAAPPAEPAAAGVNTVPAPPPTERPRTDRELAREAAVAKATQPQPTPAKPAAATAQPADKPAAKPAEKPPAKPVAAPAPAGRWYVQVGSFASEANARRLADQLKGRGHAATVSRGSGKAPWRVRVGPVADATAAKALRARLAGQGHAGSVVAP